ncbi:hypothetical protein PR048_029819 [Dryococelus australis]|uniref:Uncharacterized protein n=1 Tax=Dryococelus australis TaxID=614101 RepID=A0ABQ9GA49_9NEOP|nr:hypothetical protein PR048_029819 [Dryococelus australis]
MEDKENPFKGEQNVKTTKCSRCNRKYAFGNCPAYGKKYFQCGKENHFSSVCRFKSVKEVCKTCRNDKWDELFVDSIVKGSEIKSNVIRSWMEILKIGNEMVKFKTDTESEVNIISKNVEKISMTKTNVILEAYEGTQIKPLGKVELECETSNKFVVLEFL